MQEDLLVRFRSQACLFAPKADQELEDTQECLPYNPEAGDLALSECDR